MMQKLKPRAIIFDLGSTLIEYESVPWEKLVFECAEAARQFLLNLSIDLPPKDEFLDIFESTRLEFRAEAVKTLGEYTVPEASREILSRLGIDHDDELIEGMFGAYYQRVRDGLYIYADTLRTLQRIKESNITIGLISNTIFPESAHQGELTHFGISDYFDFTVFSSSFGKRKPHADIFRHAIRLAGCRPEEAVYIGDRYLEDITGPHAIGLQAILKVKNGREYPSEMPLAIRRIRNLAELADHIDLG